MIWSLELSVAPTLFILERFSGLYTEHDIKIQLAGFHTQWSPIIFTLLGLANSLQLAYSPLTSSVHKDIFAEG
jgi:hypothetical protein